VNLLELAGQAEHAENLDVIHGGLQIAIEGADSLVAHVVKTCDATQSGGKEAASAAVVLDQAVLVEDGGGGMHEVHAALQQGGVLRELLRRDAVHGGVAQHAHVQVGVAQPLSRLHHGGYRAQHHLCVQHVGQLFHKLTLDRQLLVHKRQVILQLRVRGHDDAFSLRV